MPRQARIDYHGLLQHVIVRGIERHPIVIDDTDRESFVSRLEQFTQKSAVDCYAWTLLDNHFHLLVRPRTDKLAVFMRRLQTSYAVTFNRRHRRSGHLFQNRYKSIVCDENVYLLELIRYIHLNPLRAGVVSTLEELDLHPWCGHSQLMGTDAKSIIDLDLTLPLFSQQSKKTRQIYRQFLQDTTDCPSTNLSSGGKKTTLFLDNSLSEDDFFDDRILGGGSFAEKILKHPNPDVSIHKPTLDQLIQVISKHFDLPKERLSEPGKSPLLTQAKAVVSYIAVRRLAYPGVEVARKLCITPGAVSHATRRGEQIIRQDKSVWNILREYL